MNVICQSFESGKRQKMILQDGKISDDYLELLFQTIRLTPIQVIAYSFALTQSQNIIVATEGLRLMRKYLPSASGNFLADISEEILNGIKNFIVRTKVRSSSLLKLMMV